MEEFVYHGPRRPICEVLTERLALSYGAAQKLLRKKDVKINGVRTGRDAWVAEGDRLAVYAPARPALEERVLYADDNVLVLDKPRRLDTYEAAARLGETYGELIPVHRLDRNTAGVMVFARTAPAQTALERCFREGAADKRYRALVAGRVEPDEATLTAYLKKDAEAARVTVRARPGKGYDRIVTAYRVVDRRADCTELEVRLLTGRTHQIRAHLAYLGHPVIGDGKYGDNAVNRRFGKRFQELTCVSLMLRPGAPLDYLAGREFRAD